MKSNFAASIDQRMVLTTITRSSMPPTTSALLAQTDASSPVTNDINTFDAGVEQISLIEEDAEAEAQPKEEASLPSVLQPVQADADVDANADASGKPPSPLTSNKTQFGMHAFVEDEEHVANVAEDNDDGKENDNNGNEDGQPEDDDGADGENNDDDDEEEEEEDEVSSADERRASMTTINTVQSANACAMFIPRQAQQQQHQEAIKKITPAGCPDGFEYADDMEESLDTDECDETDDTSAISESSNTEIEFV